MRDISMPRRGPRGALHQPARLYIGGGSGGGVLSSWAIGKTDRFAAASVKRPVINWTSTALTTDIGAAMGSAWLDRRTWEEPEKHWAPSVGTTGTARHRERLRL